MQNSPSLAIHDPKSFICRCKSCGTKRLLAIAFLALLVIFGLLMVSGNLPGYINTDRIKEHYAALFSTPIQDVHLSDVSIQHGHEHFRAESSHSQSIRQDRGFEQIDVSKGQFPPPDLKRFVQCFFQPNDLYLTADNDDLWVYADKDFKTVYVVSDDHVDPERYQHLEERVFPQFHTMFPDQLNPRDFYSRGTKKFFVVSAYYGKIEPRDKDFWQTISGDAMDLPPREKQRRDSDGWNPSVTYYHKGSPSYKDPSAWVAVDRSGTVAFVIIERHPHH
jgi:hypothetical protein